MISVSDMEVPEYLKQVPLTLTTFSIVYPKKRSWVRGLVHLITESWVYIGVNLGGVSDSVLEGLTEIPNYALNSML